LVKISEATVTLSAKISNMSASKQLPVTVDSMGRQDFELVTLKQINPLLPWRYEWDYKWKMTQASN